MPKLLEIHSCFKCHHRKNGRCWHDDIENQNGKIILIEVDGINALFPSWCPLPDSKESELSNDT